MDKESFLIQAKNLGLEIKPTKDNFYIIENYFFNSHNNSVELHLEEDFFEIRHFKAYWMKIHSPEEIITLNYYEYFLPKNFDLDKIPVFWLEKYEQAGLLEDLNNNFSEARKRSLLYKIHEHFGNLYGIKDETFWLEVAKEFSDCIYTGPAYRAVISSSKDFNPSLLKKVGYSWALTLSGVKEFIHNGDAYDAKNDPGFILCEGVVMGISLIHIEKLHKDVFSQVIPNSSQFKEEEIILLELISLNKTQETKAKNLI